MRLQPSPVKQESQRLGIPCLTPPKVSAADFCRELRKLEPDFLAVAAFGEILKERVLDIPRIAPINVHASLLPRLRGAAPVNWAIMRGERLSGITTFIMNAGMDTGDILLQEEITIGKRETAGELAEKLSILAAAVLLDTLKGMEEGAITPVPQDGSLATYAPRLAKHSGVMEWQLSSDELDRFVRGVTPWPGAQTRFRGKRLRILRAREAPESPAGADPGTLIRVTPDGLLVAAGGGSAILLELLQPEAKRPMDAGSFAAGYRPSPGEEFGR